MITFQKFSFKRDPKQIIRLLFLPSFRFKTSSINGVESGRIFFPLFNSLKIIRTFHINYLIWNVVHFYKLP